MQSTLRRYNDRVRIASIRVLVKFLVSLCNYVFPLSIFFSQKKITYLTLYLAFMVLQHYIDSAIIQYNNPDGSDVGAARYINKFPVSFLPVLYILSIFVPVLMLSNSRFPKFSCPVTSLRHIHSSVPHFNSHF